MNKNNVKVNKNTNKVNKKYRLYWMYDNSIAHQDPLIDGYIGVTSKSLKSRLNHHISTKYSPGVKVHRTKLSVFVENAKELVIKELCWSYSDKDIAMIERAFRPVVNTGWNTHPGGKSIFGKSRPFIITKPDGTEERYETFWDARQAGYHDANCNEALNKPEKRKTFDFGHTARWVD